MEVYLIFFAKKKEKNKNIFLVLLYAHTERFSFSGIPFTYFLNQKFMYSENLFVVNGCQISLRSGSRATSVILVDFAFQYCS